MKLIYCLMKIRSILLLFYIFIALLVIFLNIKSKEMSQLEMFKKPSII